MSANRIVVDHSPPSSQLKDMGVENWPIWTKEESEFPWTYEEEEICYFLGGEVEVTPQGGTPVKIGRGDLVRFPAGMSCVWKITRAVRKHYSFP